MEFNSSTSGIVSNESTIVYEPNLKKLKGVDTREPTPIRWADGVVVGTDIANEEFQTNPSIHYQIKGKPHARQLEQNWLNDLNRMSWVFSLDPPGKTNTTPNSAHQLFNLESMNHHLHKQQLDNATLVLKAKEELGMLLAEAQRTDAKDDWTRYQEKLMELETLEISPDWVENYVTYHGICNNELPLASVSNRERVIVIIAQAMTDIVNSFVTGLTAHDRMFFLIKEVCIRIDQVYRPSSRVSQITLEMPKPVDDYIFSYITRIECVRQRERNIYIDCPHKKAGNVCQSNTGYCNQVMYEKSYGTIDSNGVAIKKGDRCFMGRVIFIGRVDLNLKEADPIQRNQNIDTVAFQRQAKYPLSAWLCYT